MKRRIRKVVNFFAFNLLFFALYLNFIHKDKPNVAAAPSQVQTNTAALSGTVLVANPEKYLDQKNATTTTQAQQANSSNTNKAEQNAALKLSIN